VKQPVKWQRSFRYAYEGVKYALATQRNMKFHFAAALVVLTLALFFRLTKYDILFLLLAVTLVIVTELINTAVEKAVDLAMPELHPLAKIAKDVAAASVLVTAAFAAVTGMIVFYEPVDRWLRQARGLEGAAPPEGTVWLLLSLLALAVIAAQTRFAKSGFRWKPSLLAAISFAAAALIACRTEQTLPALLAFFLAGLLCLTLWEKGERSISSLLLGAALGSFTAYLAYYLYLIR